MKPKVAANELKSVVIAVGTKVWPTRSFRKSTVRMIDNAVTLKRVIVVDRFEPLDAFNPEFSRFNTLNQTQSSNGRAMQHNYMLALFAEPTPYAGDEAHADIIGFVFDQMNVGVEPSRANAPALPAIFTGTV